MSNEALIGIIITVVIGISAFFVVTKKKSVKINQKNKNGNASINNNIIGNEINKKK
jgi:CBS domain containing-hemolysin-like protein